MQRDLLFPSYKTDLQNRVTRYDVTNWVTNSKVSFFKIFWVSNSMWKDFNIALKLVIRDF